MKGERRHQETVHARVQGQVQVQEEGQAQVRVREQAQVRVQETVRALGTKDRTRCSTEPKPDSCGGAQRPEGHDW